MTLLILSWLRSHWRLAMALGLLFVAFGAGRFTVRKETKTVTVEKIQWKERVITQVVEKQAEQKETTKTLVVYRDIVKRPDGSSETKEETRQTTGIEDRITQDTATQTVKTLEGTKTAQSTTTTKVGGSGQNWFLSASLGVPVSLRAPFAGTPFVIVDLSRRIFGPLELGVWGSLNVKGQDPAMGLSVGVGF